MLQYLVKRKGCPIPDYGLVDMGAAKRQRLGAVPLPPSNGASADSTGVCPVPLGMVEEYEVGWLLSLRCSFMKMKDK